MRTVEVNGHKLVVVESPLYSFAHPDEPCDPHLRCERCLLAKRQDTNEVVLLWLVGDVNWAVSRNDANYERHKQELQ